jgi:sulfur-oxidizing protein SoxA
MRPAGSALAGLLLAAWAASAAEEPIAPADKRSGREFQSPATRAMQDDDFANPGMLWVAKGEELWGRPPAAGAAACAGCHGDARASMRGAAARHPAFDPLAGRVVNLEQRINRCRERQGAPALAYESDELLALTAFVAHQSRGLPIDVEVEGPARPSFEAGRRLYHARLGQLNLSCAHCHDRNWGKRLRSEQLSQGQATGYPIYRLEWQAAGSLHRRLRACMAGVRAEPFEPGAREYVDLELYLAWRARGLAVETPAVRR